jgi:hypothetical protein
VVDEGAAYGLGTGGEEVGPAVELPADEQQVRLVNQGRRVEGAPGGFLASRAAASRRSSS